MSPTNPRATPCCEFCRHPECVAARAGCPLPDRQLRQDRALVWTTTTFGAGASTPMEGAPTYENAVHGSDSPEAAAREIALFFPEWRS